MQQLTNGVSYLHENRIAHRDLKPENILLFERGVLKITDYGFAKQVMNATLQHKRSIFFFQCDDGDMSSTFCGTKLYKAPELLQKHEYDPFKADVWSVLFVSIHCFFHLPFSFQVTWRHLLCYADQHNAVQQRREPNTHGGGTAKQSISIPFSLGHQFAVSRRH